MDCHARIFSVVQVHQGSFELLRPRTDASGGRSPMVWLLSAPAVCSTRIAPTLASLRSAAASLDLVKLVCGDERAGRQSYDVSKLFAGASHDDGSIAVGTAEDHGCDARLLIS